MPEAVGEVDVVIRGNLTQYRQDLALARAEAVAFDQEIGGGMLTKLPAGFNAASREAQGFLSTFAGIKTAIQGLGVAIGVEKLIGYADTWSDLNSRLRNATGSVDSATEAMSRLEDVARRTYSPLAQTVNSFVANSQSLKQLGLSTKQQLDYTESLNNALVVTSTKGEQAAAVENALSRAINLGSLRGIEFNTVMANGGAIAQSLADHLTHGNVNALRQMAAEGKITAAVIVNSLIGDMKKFQKQADAMPATIQDAFTQIGTSLLVFIGMTDQAGKLTDSFAKRIVNLADDIRGAAVPMSNFIGITVNAFNSLGTAATVIGDIAETVFVGIIGTYALSSIVSFTAAISGPLITAIKSLWVVMFANPITALIGAFALAATAAFIFRDNIKSALGIDVVGIARNAANFTIGAFVGAFDLIKTIWNSFGTAVQAGLTGAFNITVELINNVVNGAIDDVNILIRGINGLLSLIGAQKAAQWLGFSAAIPQIDNVTVATEKANTAAQDLSTVWSDLNTRLNADLNKDYIGAIGKAISATNSLKKSTDDAGNSALHLANTLDPKLQKALDKIVLSSNQYIANQKLARDEIGLSAVAAATLTNEQDMLNKAQEEGIPLTPQIRQQFHDLAAQMAQSADQTAKLQQAFNFAKDATNGFLSDLKDGLKQGQGFFQSFGNAVLNVLDKIVDKLLNNVTDALFSVGSVAQGQGGLGGFLTSIFSGITGAFTGGFGSGGVKAAVGTFSSFMPASVYHSGGTIGQTQAPHRMIPSSTFIGAPRLHNGLAPGEFPAILKQGERVTPTGLAGLNNPVKVHLQIDTNPSEQFVQQVRVAASQQAQVEIKKSDALKARNQYK